MSEDKNNKDKIEISELNDDYEFQPSLTKHPDGSIEFHELSIVYKGGKKK